jgi:hypothetical protein
MSFSQITQVITVERITSTGLFANGEWINIGKKARESGITPGNFVVGKSYEIQGYQSSEGKQPKYINTFKEFAPGASVPAPAQPSEPSAAGNVTGSTSSPEPVPAAPKDKPVQFAYGRPLSEYDKRKDISIRVSGIMQALIASPTFTPGPEGYRVSVSGATRAFLADADLIIEERLSEK